VTLPPPCYLAAVASDPPADLVLTPLQGEGRTVEQWLTMFHLATVVIDPYTNESSWLLGTAARILRHFDDAAVRVSFTVTGPPEDAKAFLGPLADEFLTFTDPDRLFVKAIELERLPAFVFVQADGTTQGVAEGWHPAEWRKVADLIASITSWLKPLVPDRGDPTPFEGTPALG
jgi:hypothetical protein